MKKEKDLLLLAIILCRLDRIEADLAILKGELKKTLKNQVSLPRLKKTVKSTLNRTLSQENSKGKKGRGGKGIKQLVGV